LTVDPFAALQSATRSHRRSHGCEAYTHEDGPALTRLAAASGALQILELGTALGYTACSLAHSNPKAQIDTIEGDPDHARLARTEIAAVGLSHRITVHQGDFAAVLRGLAGGYDLVFFDGYAPSLEILDLLTAVLRPGGTLVCANVGLAQLAEFHRLMTVLDDNTIWTKVGSIERGGTLIRVKLGKVRVDG